MKSAAAAPTALAAAFLLTACASPPVATAPVTQVDGVLVATRGMTLYTFDKDAPGSGRSACDADCASRWQPLFVGGRPQPGGDFSTVARDDGRIQWAFRGKPLYTWCEDRRPGERYGAGYLDAWRVAKP